MFRNFLTKNRNNLKFIKRYNSSSVEKKIDEIPTGKLFFWGTTIATSSYLFYSILKKNSNYENISIKELEKKKTNFEKVTIFDGNIALVKKCNEDAYYRVNIPNGEYFEKKINTEAPIYYENTVNITSLLGPMVSLGILGTVLFMMSKNTGGLKSIIDLNKSIEIQKIKTRFTDVVGQRNARRAVSEFVNILKNKEKYTDLGVTVPKGALLSGPPGTGKTLLAKAIAGESQLPFVNMTGSDFNAMFVGVGSAKIKNLYKTAKEAAEEHGGCIVFIDEIDAIGQKRSSANTIGGNSERENTLNQLLTEMDGFDSNKNVITFAATNRPELLDPALLRPGRFDRKISVDLPTINDRKELFKFYLNKLNLDKNIISNISDLSSKLTPGFSGADIANIVNEAGIIAVRNNKKEVEEQDIKSAIDYVMMGDEKDNILLDSEKEIVSYHEAGHALLSYILPLVENPIKVSIIPREKGMLGFSQSEVSMENLTTKNKMEQYIKVLMGGRAAEEIFCKDVTNGASNDIEKASEIARNYINTYGFGNDNKFLNTIDNNPYKNDVSNYVRDKSDKDVIEFLNKKYTETLDLIRENKDSIENIKNLLLTEETIYNDQIKNIINN